MPKWHLYFISLCRRKNGVLAVKHLTAFKLYYVSSLSHTYAHSHTRFISLSLKKTFKNHIIVTESLFHPTLASCFPHLTMNASYHKQY